MASRIKIGAERSGRIAGLAPGAGRPCAPPAAGAAECARDRELRGAGPDRRRQQGRRSRACASGSATASSRSSTADLVVDASGRGSSSPAWLESLGYRAAGGRADRDRDRLHHARLSPPSDRSRRQARGRRRRQRAELAQRRRPVPDRGSLDRLDRRLFRRPRARRRADVRRLCRLAADIGDLRHRRPCRAARRFRPLSLSRQSAAALRAADANFRKAIWCSATPCAASIRSTARA